MSRFVAFTGSVEGGHAIQQAASAAFHRSLPWSWAARTLPTCATTPMSLRTAANLVEGSFYNAGTVLLRCRTDLRPSGAVYEPFLEAFVCRQPTSSSSATRATASTTLGPVVRVRNAEGIQAQVDEAIAAGARPLLDPGITSKRVERGLPYMAPQALGRCRSLDADHERRDVRAGGGHHGGTG